MRRRAGIVLALLLVLTGCTPAEPAGPAAEPAAEPVYMALTFDDGPSPSNAPRLLEGLSRRGVRATFFLVGSRIEGRDDLVRRIRQEGHQIGNHSFGHGDLTDLSAAQALADLDKCSRALERVLGPGSYWLRPPYGFISQEELCALGTPAICWSVDTEDWKSQRGQHPGHRAAAGRRRGYPPAPRLLSHQRHGGPGDRGPIAASGGAVRHRGGAVRRQGGAACLRDPVPPCAGRIKSAFCPK